MIFSPKIFALTLLISMITGSLTHVRAQTSENPCASYGLHQPFPSTPITEVPYSVLTYYHQKEPLLVDPAGDFVLYAMSQTLPQHILWMTTKSENIGILKEEIQKANECANWFFKPDLVQAKSPAPTDAAFTPSAQDIAVINSMDLTPEQKADLQNRLIHGKLRFESHQRPLDDAGMLAMFSRVIQQEYALNGTEPTVGEFHQWSEQFLKTDIKDTQGLHWVNHFGKLLIALSKGDTERFMMTGNEEQIRAWILSQPMESVTLPELFRASYRLSKGDVYQTLLGIENLLARDWDVKNRENLPIIQHLTRITHEFGSKESRFGDWYHFFGITTLGYTKNKLVGLAVAEIEVLGSIVMNHFPGQYQKHSLNRNGALIGHSLKKIIEKQSWKKMKLTDEALQPTSYLTPFKGFEKEITSQIGGSDVD